jgi:aryl-alcohol dehydrogenase-like predicted oxidoreductase
MTRITRRDFIQKTAKTAAAIGVLGSIEPVMAAEPQIQKRTLGKTGYEATVLGFGGAYLNKEITKEDAASVLHKAIDLGINYIDTAANYGGGISEEYIGEVMKTRRKEVFIATKTDLRGKDESAEQINTSLRKLRTDFLDLIQLHYVNTEEELKKVIAKNGSLSAVMEAKEAGKARFIGVTAHNWPILAAALEVYPFDTVLLPLSALDYSSYEFSTMILPVVEKHNIGVIGMKSLGGGVLRDYLSVKECLNYSFSMPAAVTVVGMKSIAEVKENVAIARSFVSMGQEELDSMHAKIKAVFPPDKHGWSK